MTLWDAMIEMYDRYGYYKDDVKSITLSGKEGLEKIKNIMDNLRVNAPKEIAGYKVKVARDYQNDVICDIETGEKKPTGLPSSNVLYYELGEGVWFCVRPSGTEPKIKFYYGVVGKSMEDADALSEKFAKELLAFVDSIM